MRTTCVGRQRERGLAKLGVVLSSGGGRGVFGHTGFLLALRELGIDAAVMAGSSAGALVGGIAASGTDMRRWAQVISKVAAREYWRPDSLLRIMWQITVKRGRGYTGFADTAAAVEFVRRHLAVQHFEQCPTPFYAWATNLTSGDKFFFSSGELAPRIMASAAMPVLYRPVEIGGEFYCDGAAIEFAKGEALCCKHGLDALVIHHTTAHRDGPAGLARALHQPWSLVEILYLLLYRQHPWYVSRRAFSAQACPYGCGAAVVVLEPELPELRWPLSKGGPEVQEAAYVQAKRVLAPHVEALLAAPRTLLNKA